MTQPTNSLFKTVKAIEAKGHVAAVFVRGNSNFRISAADYDPDLPGLWVCKGASGHPITIDEASVTAIVEHDA